MSERFFHPRSVLWRVDREMVLLLGGGRALLMQLAHPKVAVAVAEHSRFRRDPLGRLYQTMDTMWSIVFDEESSARESLARLRRIHRSVRGTIRQGDVVPVGTSYTAEDPELLLWVHATLVDSTLVAYERFVGPLSDEDKREYYVESRRLGALLGISDSRIPPTLDAFGDYMKAMIASGAIIVGATARMLAREILHPRPLVLKVGGPLSSFITVGLLPPVLREAFGLEWSPKKEWLLKLLSRSIRAVVRFLPAMVRVVPHARAAEALRELSLGQGMRVERGSR